jgi:hypothetical protein
MIAWCVSARLYVSVPAQAHPTSTETMLPLRHEASTRTGAASPRKSCQSPPCQCYGFRLPVARVNPPCRTWRPGGVLGGNAQCQRMNPPCKTWRPGGVQCDDTRYRRMNPPCKTRRPRKSKTRTRDAIRPHNRKRRAPLPRATIIVTNSGRPQPRACFRDALQHETTSSRAQNVITRSDDRQPKQERRA